MAQAVDIPIIGTPNPGASATATVLDTTAVRNSAVPAVVVSLAQRCARLDIRRVDVCITIDQNATFFTDWIDPLSNTWRTWNGNGSGEPILANTPFQRSVKRVGLDFRIRIVTVNNPTLWEVMGCINPSADLSQ